MQQRQLEFTMSLQFLGGDTGGGGSPRLYTEGGDYLVQGYTVTEPHLLSELKLPDGEAAVRVPPSLWNYLPAGLRVYHSTEEEEGEKLASWKAATFAAEQTPERSTGYIRFDRRGTSLYVPATGPGAARRPALMLPEGYLRGIDRPAVLVSHRAGDWRWAEGEIPGDPALARQCSLAVTAVQAICAYVDRNGPDGT
jgi:hypothetical protein